jgi:hypothetical protein
MEPRCNKEKGRRGKRGIGADACLVDQAFLGQEYLTG